jgi:hypothetical protein
MDNKPKNSNKAGNARQWVGVGTAIGVAVFAATNEPVWIAVGVAMGAAQEDSRGGSSCHLPSSPGEVFQVSSIKSLTSSL